jgi:hypothetical protein
MDSLDIDVKESLVINEGDLDTELANVSSYYYLFSSMSTDAENQLQQIQLNLEVYEVALAGKIKEELISNGAKADKITETEIKRQYRKDDKWIQLRKQVIEAECDFKKLEKAAKSFDMKSQNCMSLNKRQLYKASKGMLGVEDL